MAGVVKQLPEKPSTDYTNRSRSSRQEQEEQGQEQQSGAAVRSRKSACYHDYLLRLLAASCSCLCKSVDWLLWA